MTWAFWRTADWKEYSDKYGGGHGGNDGTSGNLLVPIEDPLVMWKRLSKGHRADVKRAEREGVLVDIIGGRDYPDDFNNFRLLHAKDAGRVTRSLETWQCQQGWVRDGHAALALAHEGDWNDLLAAALFITYESRAYYAVAARDPDRADRRASHLLIWRFMCWLSRNGYKEMDMGPVPEDGDVKGEGIADFKRHFGAQAVRVA